jgi:hypothetical protein
LIYNVLLKKVSTDIDNEVLIEVNEIELTCFIDICYEKIEVGKRYDVNIIIDSFDSLDMKHSTSYKNNFRKIGNTFGYLITGKFNFNKRTINSSILLDFDEDEIELCGYEHLDGQNIEIRVLRIGVEFL